MNGDNIYCFMVTGARLTDAIRTLLFVKAQEMVKKEKNRLKIVHDDVEGLIATTGEMVTFGSISGYKFNAEIETEKYRTKVAFLIRPCDLPAVGVWDVW